MSLDWRWLPKHLALGLLLSGCAHDPRPGSGGASAAGGISEDPPVFLKGAAAMLLTQADGFSAHVTLTTGASSPINQGLAGELRGRAGKLALASVPGKARTARGGISIIWDVAQGRGNVLSEALQGYAPVVLSVRPTNCVSFAASTTPEAVEGHPCRQELATVAMSDGSSANFRVWRAMDLKHFPVRISVVTTATPFVLNLSSIRLESPPADVFTLPEGFTRYASADAMMAELMIRQRNLRHEPVPVTSEPAYEVPRRH